MRAGIEIEPLFVDYFLKSHNAKQMATLAGILVADKYSVLDSGAAFLLAQKCDVSEVVYPDSDSEVEVQEGCPYVITRIRGASSADDAFNKGHEVAQQGLDLLSITGKADLSIKNASDEYLVWWREKSVQILRVVAVTKIDVTFKATLGKATDKDGNIVQPLLPKPIYDESLRYFRLSQVTDDLFDAFRNAYLAFESILARIEPRRSREREGGRSWEPEGAWLKRALKSVNNTVPLSRAYSATTSDIVSDICQDIYENIRCSIFHAKNQPRLLPQSLADREKVSEGLDRLTRIVLLLAENWLYAGRPSGVMFPSAFDGMMKPLVSNSIVVVSDNNAPLNGSETLRSLALKDSVPMVTRYAPERSRPGLNSVLGTIETEELQNLSKIARFVSLREEKLMFHVALEAPLTYNSVDRLELQVSVQLRNVREPKRFFKM